MFDPAGDQAGQVSVPLFSENNDSDCLDYHGEAGFARLNPSCTFAQTRSEPPTQVVLSMVL
jgi:hypothetical protein